MNRWTEEEIRLTRFAWAMKDADEWLQSRQRARYRRDIVVTGVTTAVAVCMATACVALFVLSQW